MSPDDEAEQALRAAYAKALQESLSELELGLSEGYSKDTVARLHAQYYSFPAYSVWRKAALINHEAQAYAEARQGSNGQSGRAASPGAAVLRATQLSGGAKATREEWGRLMDWAKAHGGRRIRGDDGKWNLSEQELAEALG